MDGAGREAPNAVGDVPEATAARIQPQTSHLIQAVTGPSWRRLESS
ncbi:hypothetical protein LUTEI9C_30022 [Luteimonas sp. 9C]|nr:hypothetical protein LUTEI9C_30022 [Luteimonas sp. 9C]